MLIPTLQKHGLSMASLGAVTGWRFTAGAFVQGATGRGSALGHGVLPLNLLKCTEPTRLLEGQSSLKKAIAEMTASTKAGHSLRCFSALDSRGLEGRASPDSLHSALLNFPGLSAIKNNWPLEFHLSQLHCHQLLLVLTTQFMFA